MADRYWVGGNGTWDNLSILNWSAISGGTPGASAPTSIDNVFFDNLSFATSYAITTGSSMACANLNISGPLTGSVTFNDSANQLTISGDFTQTASGVIWDFASGLIKFISTTGQTVNSSGLSLSSSIEFNGVGGTWVLSSNLTTGSSKTVTLTNGTLSLNNKVLSVGLFNSSNANIRTLAFGVSGVIELSGNNITILNLATVTNLTISGTPVVNLIYAGNVGTRTINPGILPEASALSINVESGHDVIVDVFNSTYKNLNFVGFEGTFRNIQRTIFGNLTLDPIMSIDVGANITTFAATSGPKTIKSNGNTIRFPLIFNGVGGIWQLLDNLSSSDPIVLTNGIFNSNNFNITCRAFLSNNVNIRSILMGSSIWTLTGIASLGQSWDVGTDPQPNLTLSAGTSTIFLNSLVDHIFASGNKTYFNLVKNNAAITSLQSGGTYNSISNIGSAGTLLVEPFHLITIINSFLLNGAAGSLFNLGSTSTSDQFTMSKSSGTVTVNFLSISDSGVSGGATWNAVNSVDIPDDNSGWNFIVNPPFVGVGNTELHLRSFTT